MEQGQEELQVDCGSYRLPSCIPLVCGGVRRSEVTTFSIVSRDWDGVHRAIVRVSAKKNKVPSHRRSRMNPPPASDFSGLPLHRLAFSSSVGAADPKQAPCLHKPVQVHNPITVQSFDPLFGVTAIDDAL